jgi:hypothetical protein
VDWSGVEWIGVAWSGVELSRMSTVIMSKHYVILSFPNLSDLSSLSLPSLFSF